MLGAQWLSGRVLDSRPKGRGFEPHRRHCVVSLSKNINPSLVLVQPRKTRPFITERLLMGRKESNQTNKQTNKNKMHVYANGITWVVDDYSSHNIFALFVLYFVCFSLFVIVVFIGDFVSCGMFLLFLVLFHICCCFHLAISESDEMYIITELTHFYAPKPQAVLFLLYLRI